MSGTMSIPQFLAHIASITSSLKRAEHHSLEAAAQTIATEAKAEIGHYQSAVGPFAAWDPLADSTVREKERQGYAPPDNPLLRTGEMRDSIEHAVGDGEAVVGSNDPVAVYQELGTSSIPPRSFLGGAAARKSADVANILGSGTVKALGGRGVVGTLPIP